MSQLTGTVCTVRQEGSQKRVAGAAASGAAVTPGEENARKV